MKKTLALLAIPALALGGCASIVKGSSQSIAISTPPTEGASCVLSSGQGNWTVTSPGSVKVERSKEDIRIHCSKPGWQDGLATIPSNFEGWTVGNLLIGGIVGVGVDAATGAINQYPKTFQVPLVQVMAPAPAPAEPQAPTEPQQPKPPGV